MSLSYIIHRFIKKVESREDLTRKSFKLNFIMAIVTIFSLGVTAFSTCMLTNTYIEQQIPKVYVKPFAVVQKDGVITYLKVVNYSGFDAYKINIDVSLGENDFVGEWIRARDDAEEKGHDKIGVEPNKQYSLFSKKSLISKLPAGEVEVLPNRNDNKAIEAALSSSYSLKGLCETNTRVTKAAVRASWENKKEVIFEKVQYYKVMCTRDNQDGNPDAERGRAFTFIPEGNNSDFDHVL